MHFRYTLKISISFRLLYDFLDNSTCSKMDLSALMDKYGKKIRFSSIRVNTVLLLLILLM